MSIAETNRSEDNLRIDKLLRSFPSIPQSRQWSGTLHRIVPYGVSGKVRSVRGTTVIVDGLPVPVGSIVHIHRHNEAPLEGEVIGFDAGKTLVAPLDSVDGVRSGERVELFRSFRSVQVSPEIIGRVIDASGQPIDDGPELPLGWRIPCDASPAPALSRPPIDTILTTRVRAIDSMLTVGKGQRLGIFAGSGVGKSTLLGMLARGTEADHVVIALIGERGREVREFLERDLGEEGRKKCTTVVATSDQPAPRRILAAKTATAIAEALRDQGKSVLLLMDSVTRFAMAQREIGLAAGEVPTTRGYPPSVFAMLPQLVERTGKTQRGSITAFYTVLVEGDDPNEPISDALRGLLDGHIHLSRSVASRGRYPAIDILPSLSRLQFHLIQPPMRAAAESVRNALAIYRDNEDLINIGAYARGSNPQIDWAIQQKPLIESFLSQERDSLVSWEVSFHQLMQIGSSAPPVITNTANPSARAA
ncbi:MAG: FliI/YscN family ATPase [Pirellula sp.]|jgi:flagellum-specific ATP synthase|nr:FliI/YscN family ATPase [Pirellula sp.]